MSEVPAPVELVAPAKLTVSLRVTGVRADGYHLIDAEMVSLDLVDELSVDPTGDELLVDTDGDVQAGRPDDLVQRALESVGRTASVVLRKRIPAGAGLGGGSSDAAAVLRWAGVTSLEHAVQLGADVPFCLRGGRARVGGIGEVVEPLPFEPLTYTLWTPPVHCSTPVVYRMWDELGGPVGEAGNDLEPAALAAFPELAAYRDELAGITGVRPRLAGSGSTWFVEGAFPGGDRRVVRTQPSLG
ncbi:MAG: 4-(cytidine 5'-diphospho)-2-C-methyl-D-erythritol kinase [Microthrixaceae bacterium]